jgi:hypothetical protein
MTKMVFAGDVSTLFPRMLVPEFNSSKGMFSESPCRFGRDSPARKACIQTQLGHIWIQIQGPYHRCTHALHTTKQRAGLFLNMSRMQGLGLLLLSTVICLEIQKARLKRRPNSATQEKGNSGTHMCACRVAR